MNKERNTFTKRLFPLRSEYPLLFANITAIATLLFFLGLALALSPPVPVNAAKSSLLSILLDLHIWGAIFLALGIGIFVGLGYNHGYRRLRWVLIATMGIVTMWTFSLIEASISGRVSSASVAVLWIYLNYNVFKVVTDKGFAVVSAVKEANNAHGHDAHKITDRTDGSV
jgi:hypothetical protein